MADNLNVPAVKKHPKGKLLKSGEKQIVLNIFNSLMKKHLTMPVNDIIKLTNECTDVSQWSVRDIREELKEISNLKILGKKRWGVPKTVLGFVQESRTHG